MIKEVSPKIFQIRVPLPNSPLGHLNSYLIKSEEKNLLIDTGLNFPQSFQSLSRGLSEAGIETEELSEILLTHFHVDHVGLIPRFKETSRNIKLSIHRVEAELSEILSRGFEDFKESMVTFLRSNGAPSSIAFNLQRFRPAFFNPRAYGVLVSEALPLENGQVVSVGDYNFQVLWTPGHSPGHICLYEPSHKILVSGDNLLPTITSHIGVWWFMEDMDPLTDYLNSLEKMEKLDVELVLPAHEEIFTDHRERIKQLKDHHKQRLTEILDGLKTGSLTAYALASKVDWNVNYKSWDEFPSFQIYMALGEIVAHLIFLERKGLVKRTKTDQIISYHVNKNSEEIMPHF